MKTPILPLAMLALVAGAASAENTVIRIPASAFSTDGGTAISVQFESLSGYWVKTAPGGAGLHSTVEFPDGVTIVRVTSFFYDNDASGDLEANLRRKSWVSGSGSSEVIGATNSSGASTADQSDDANIIYNPIVDNTNYFYFIQVGFSSTAGQRRLYSMEVEYADPATAAGAGVESALIGSVTNHPNPFRSHTVVRFPLESAGGVWMDIYDAGGRRIRTMVESFVSPGTHEIEWDGRNDSGQAMPSGVYFAQVRSETEALAAKLVRVK
jgi:hypothetical protein